MPTDNSIELGSISVPSPPTPHEVVLYLANLERRIDKLERKVKKLKRCLDR